MVDGPEKDILITICQLYGLHQIELESGQFLKCESHTELGVSCLFVYPDDCSSSSSMFRFPFLS